MTLDSALCFRRVVNGRALLYWDDLTVTDESLSWEFDLDRVEFYRYYHLSLEESKMALVDERAMDVMRRYKVFPRVSTRGRWYVDTTCSSLSLDQVRKASAWYQENPSEFSCPAEAIMDLSSILGLVHSR